MQAQPNLFELMNEIDQRVANKEKKAILFVGKTKAGKSTSFNWISHVPLKAVREGGRGRKICYQPQAGQIPAARVTPGFTSCTLVPNISSYKGYNIIDTAGYEDKRNYIGTIGVAYSLKAIFQVIEEVKFVIVLPETGIYSNLSDLFATFNNFLSMFKITQITPQTKAQIFASTSLLLTKCEKPEDIRSDIENCLVQLKNQSLDLKNKVLISQLLTHLLQKDKIVYFKMATVDQTPQRPQVLERLSEKQWSFFNIKQARTAQQIPKSIVQLPFNPLYQKLQQSQKQLIRQSLGKRINSYKQICQILHDVIAPNLQIHSINKTSLKYQLFLAKISSFIQGNDYYQSQSHINKKEIQIYQLAPQKLNAFKLILELYSVITDIDFPQFAIYQSISQQFMKNMAKSRVRFTKLSELLMRMYGDRDSMAIKLLKLKYILLRGIREFQMLFDISPYHVSDAAQRINDALEQVFPINKEVIISNYIKSFDLDQNQRMTFNISDFSSNAGNKIEQYFVTKKDALQFEQYMAQYRKDHQYPIPQYYPLMREINLILAKYSFREQNYTSANAYLLKSFELQCQYEKYLKNTHIQAYPNTSENPIPAQVANAFNAKMKNHFLSRVIILNALKQTLIKTENYEIAIQIASINRDIISVCKIYTRILLQNLQLQKRKQLLMKFGDYCFTHGRWRQSCHILQQLYNLETGSFERKAEFNNKLVNYAQNETKSKQLYINYLKGETVIEVENPLLQELITKIKEAKMQSSSTSHQTQRQREQFDSLFA